MNQRKHTISRRNFVKQAAVVSATLGSFAIIRPGRLLAQEKRPFKIGLIGCGARGRGAVRDCLEAGKLLEVKVTVEAIADVSADQIGAAVEGLQTLGVEVPANRRFVGFDAYKKVMATDVDIVLLATSPNFRPVHFAAAVEAGKHVFMEKPVAVDPPGARKIMESGRLAAEKKLAVVAGTQRRHAKNYLATYRAVQQGAVGKILGGTVSWCGGAATRRDRQPGWSDTDYLIRNWMNFSEMSGDHIVEQHCHNIDVANWFIGTHPISAIAFGGRARRRSGNQFDYFSVDFEYPEHVHIQSMSRQVNGSYFNVSEFLRAEKGAFLCNGIFKAPLSVDLAELPGPDNPYVREHVDLLEGILKGEPVNEAQNVAESTMSAIMGRLSAYTGQRKTWKEMEKSTLCCSPSALDFENGHVQAPPDDLIPIPGVG